MSPDSLCRWKVQVSVYCARRIAAHLGCTQCSMLFHLIDSCFLPCICLLKISQIQNCLCVFVGPGFVSISPAFMRSKASACPACRELGVVVGPTPPPKNGGGVQQPFLRTPADDIPHLTGIRLAG